MSFPLEPEISRDRFGRPLVIPPDGGNPIPYTRCTTYVDVLDDKYKLGQWLQRMVALGLSQRHDLLLSMQSLAPQLLAADPAPAAKTKGDKICEQAIEAAKGSAAATTGTALHSLTEQIDRGDELGYVAADTQRDLDAYRRATEPLTALHIERFMVNDDLRIGGTPDRVVEYRGQKMIADLKGLALTTPIPTPTGWTTMGQVQVGDQVFAADGSVCNVIVKSPPKRIGTYVVTFDDGSTIVCDTEHIWWTAAGNPRHDGEPTAKPVTEIIDTLTCRGQTHHRVPVAGALDLPDVDLPIDPYLLGCWLGDGSRNRSVITKGRDLFEILADDGHDLGVEQFDKRAPHVVTRTVMGLRAKLADLDVLGDKHVPDIYLRAGTAQRLRLLQGLMDTDGCWNKPRRTAAFTNTNKALSLAVEELAASLGQRPHIAEIERSGYGLTVTAYDVEFTPVGINPFRLPRKANQASASTKPTTCASRRVIVSVDPGPDVDTACIGVDSANHTYLCGHRMIPTHNTGSVDFAALKISMQLAVYAHSQLYDVRSGERTPLDGVNLDRAIVIHLPAGTGQCRLLWVDIAAGWDAVAVAGQVRDWRKRKNLLIPLDDGVDPDPHLRERAPVEEPQHGLAVVRNAVASAASVDELTALWRAHQGVWDDELTQLAAARKALLLDSKVSA